MKIGYGISSSSLRGLLPASRSLLPLRWKYGCWQNCCVDAALIDRNTVQIDPLRTVPLSDFAVATLLAWQLRQAEEYEAAQEGWQTEGHVFTMEDGRGLDPAYVSHTAVSETP